MPIIHNSSINPLGSNQDYVTTGKTDSYSYIVLADGHGFGQLSNKLKEFDWHNITSRNTASGILSEINKEILIRCTSLHKDGATISIVKIFKDKINAYWMGDSQIHIKVNDNYYKSENHNIFNQKELERVQTISTPTFSVKILDDKNCQAQKNGYFIFKNNKEEEEPLAFSRSLGHDFITLQELEEKEISVTDEDNIAILVASDGLYDVLYEEYPLNTYPDKESSFFVELATARWKQEWIYHIPEEYRATDTQYAPSKSRFPKDDWDDVSVAVFLKTKNMQ